MFANLPAPAIGPSYVIICDDRLGCDAKGQTTSADELVDRELHLVVHDHVAERAAVHILRRLEGGFRGRTRVSDRNDCRMALRGGNLVMDSSTSASSSCPWRSLSVESTLMNTSEPCRALPAPSEWPARGRLRERQRARSSGQR